MPMIAMMPIAMPALAPVDMPPSLLEVVEAEDVSEVEEAADTSVFVAELKPDAGLADVRNVAGEEVNAAELEIATTEEAALEKVGTVAALWLEDDDAIAGAISD